MTRDELQVRMAVFCVATLCLPIAAHASGRLPMPEVTEKFKSHEACIGALHAYHEYDQRQIRPKSTLADGGTSEVQLITEGIERIGHDRTQYDARIWYHHGWRHDDTQEMEVSHSYTHRLRVCEGKTMRTSGEDGYTSSTFEPLPAAAKQ